MTEQDKEFMRRAIRLAQKGIDVVILEAGKRHEFEDFINDEWDSFAQLAWLDKRTTSGDWRVAKDFPNLPAWIVKAVGGTTTHWAGASLRFQEHEFHTLTNYGKLEGANLPDWPITLADLEPYYTKAEDKMGVTRTNGIEGLPGVEAIIENATCTINKGVTREARAIVTLTPADFLKLATGNASAPVLFMTGKLKVKGDLGFAAGFMSLFNIPKA